MSLSMNVTIILILWYIGSYVEHYFINIHDNTEYCLGVHFIPFTAHGLHYCSKYLQAFNRLTHMLLLIHVHVISHYNYCS